MQKQNMCQSAPNSITWQCYHVRSPQQLSFLLSLLTTPRHSRNWAHSHPFSWASEATTPMAQWESNLFDIMYNVWGKNHHMRHKFEPVWPTEWKHQKNPKHQPASGFIHSQRLRQEPPHQGVDDLSILLAVQEIILRRQRNIVCMSVCLLYLFMLHVWYIYLHSGDF